MAKTAAVVVRIVTIIFVANSRSLATPRSPTSPHLSYEWTQILNVGSNAIYFSVKDGAPCTAHCKLFNKNSSGNIPIVSFQQQISKPSVKHERKVNFSTTGSYILTCNFANNVGMVTKEASIFVSEASHPLTATTNTPRMVGDDFSINFDFGSWKQIVEVSGQVYFDAHIFGSEYSLGKAQRLNRTRSFDNFYVTHKYERAGRRHVRVDMLIALPSGNRFVQLLLPTIIADNINTVTLQAKCISFCDKEASYNISAHSTENVTVTFPYKSNMEISAISPSVLTDWSWTWDNTVFSRKASIHFVLSDYMNMHLTASNAFSEMNLFFVVQYHVSIEDVIITVSDTVNQKMTTDFDVIFTSFDDLIKIEKSQKADMTLQISNNKPGSQPIAISVPAESEICYQNSTNPLNQFLTTSGRSTLVNFQEGIYTYCVRTTQTSFTYAGPHHATARINHQGNKYESMHQFCVMGLRQYCREPASVKIRGHLQSSVETHRNILLFAEFHEGICFPENEYQLIFNWTLTRGDDRPLIVGYEREFFIPGEYVTLGDFEISLKMSKTGYCGETYSTAQDRLQIKTYRPKKPVVKIKGGPELIMYVNSKTRLIFEAEDANAFKNLKYKWYCCKIDEEDFFNEIYGAGKVDEIDKEGCFGKGFLLSEGVTKITSNETQVAMEAGLFRDIPDRYKIRLSITHDATNVFDDQYIELKQSSQEFDIILQSGPFFTYHPYPVVECFTNCQQYLHTSPLHLKADCKTCDRLSAQFDILYMWEVNYPTDSNNLYSSKIEDWKKHSYTITDEFLPEIRLKATAFRHNGVHKISVTLAARSRSSKLIYPVAASFYYATVPIQEAASFLCHIHPPYGQAGVTKFEIQCPSDEKDVVYEMFYSDCYACEDDESFKLFHRGYSGVATGISFAVGDFRFGYKLTVRIVKSSIVDGKSSSSYLFVKVEPPTSENAIKNLKSSLEEGSEVMKSFMQNDAIRSSTLISSVLSSAKLVEDKDLLLRANDVILHNLERIKPRSLQEAKYYSSTLKETMTFMTERIPTDDIMIRMADTISSMTTQITHIVEKDVEWKEEPLFVLFSTIGLGLKDASVMSRNAQSTSDRLFGDLAKLITVFRKKAEEFPTVIQDKNIDLSISNTRLDREPSNIHVQQNGLAFIGNAQEDALTTVQVGIAKFPFNPVVYSANNNLSNDSAVIGLVLIEKNSGNEERQGRRYISRSAAKTSLFRGKRLHILLPSANNQTSTAVRLPQPCPGSNYTGNTVLSRSRSEACGYALIQFSIDTLENGLGNSEVLMKGKSYANFRPNRPCNNPNIPCIEALLTRVVTGSTPLTDTTKQVTIDDCIDASSRTSNCMFNHEILQTCVFPLRSQGNQLPYEFTDDPWSALLNDKVIDELNSERKSVVIIIKHLQREFSTISATTIGWHLNVSVDIITASCTIWNGSRGWSDVFCGSGRPALGNTIHCECDLSNIELEKPNGVLNTILFAANLVIVPNRINSEDIIAILFRIQSHYYVLAVVFFFWLIFIFSLLWARRDDSIDAAMRETVIPVDSNINHNYFYEVVISTSVLRQSGTTAKVQIILEGDNGLKSNANTVSTENKSTLQRTGKDSFLIAVPESLGQIQKLHIWHDNGGEYPSWRLNRIAVYDLQDKERAPSFFLINSWLSMDIHPFHCHLTVTRSTEQELFSFRTMWKAHAINFLCEGCVWLSTFFKSRGSQFTRMRRLACLASAFSGSMLVTNMFIQAESQYYLFNLGFMKIDLSPLIIAIESVLIVAPLDILHIFVFNRIEPAEEKEINEVLELCNQLNQDKATAASRDIISTSVTVKPLLYHENETKTISESESESESESDSESECSVITRRTRPIRRSRTDRSTDDYASSDDDFDLRETLSDCLEIKRIAEETSTARMESSDDFVRKIKVEIIDNIVPEGKSSLSELITRYNSDSSVKKKSMKPVWYERFRVKRMLRRMRRKKEQTATSDFVKTLNDELFGPDHEAEMTVSPAMENFASLARNIVFLPQRRAMISQWVGSMVWVLTWVYLITCSIVSILYGLSYELSTFLMWLTTFSLSVVQSVLVVAPLKICIVATLQAACGKKKVRIHQWTAFIGKAQRLKAVIKWRQQQRKSREKFNGCPENGAESSQTSLDPFESVVPSFPPPLLGMIKRGKRALAVRQVKRYWYETLIWIGIAVFASVLIVYQRDPRLLRINQCISNKLKQDMTEVSSRDDIYQFLQNSLIPVLYKQDEVSIFLQFKILGPIQLRQSRYASLEICDANRKITTPGGLCLPWNEWTNSITYDTTSYDGNWGTSLSTVNATPNFESPFVYRYCARAELQLPLGSGLRRSVYPCGGYTVELGYQAEQASSIINTLKSSDWLDRHSASLIIEFSVLDIPSGYVSPYIYVMELLPTGGINIFQYTNSFRPFYIYEMKDLFVIGLQIFHVTICVFLIYSTLTEYSDVKWNIRAVVAIFMDVWHIMQIAIAVTTFTAYGYYLKHIAIADQSSKALKADSSTFVSFLEPSLDIVTSTNLISFALFLCYLRLLKILRGSEFAIVLLDTMSVARDGVANVAVLVAVVTIGFALTGVASLVSSRNSFRRIPTAFVALTSLGAGLDIPQPEHGVTEEILWSIYFLLFGIFVLVFYTNLYATVISDGLFFTKNEASKETSYQVETLALQWLYEKCFSLFGFKTKAFSGKSIKLRPPPGSVLNRDDIAEEMRISLTLDPEEGPAEKRLMTIRRMTHRKLLTKKYRGSVVTH